MTPDTLERRFVRTQIPKRGWRLAVSACALALCACGDNSAPRAALPAIEKLSAEDAVLKAKLPEDITPENHSMIMDAILGKPQHPIKQIGILVYDGVNDLDFMGLVRLIPRGDQPSAGQPPRS